MKKKTLDKVIAFRVWNTFDKKFENETDYAIMGDGIIIYNWGHDEWTTHLNHPMIISRFTGFIDANNVDIYEGDIVMCGDVIAEIEYASGCFYLAEYALYQLDLLGGHMKVIGNIFENPDKLLNN